MASLDVFARRMRSLGQRVERNANEVKKRVALVVDRNLVLSTPVDTGRARSNWIVSLGGPAREEIEAYVPGTDLGQGESGNARAAIDQGQGVIMQAVPEQPIFISNNLPYIQRLNDGYSAQAPAGMIERAIQSGERVARASKVTRR